MKNIAKDNFKSELLSSNLSISENFTALVAQKFEKLANNPFHDYQSSNDLWNKAASQHRIQDDSI